MKNVIISLSLLLITFISFSQTQADTSSSPHLSFKGVPIDGTLTEYVSKMKKSGFTLESTNDGIAILKGDFASYKDCTIGVSTLKQKDLVNKIAVLFPERDSWSSLSGNYFSLKEMLTEKYGKPVEVVEKFQNYEPKDDGSKMYQVKFDACKYYATYEITKGTIYLSIDHDGVTSCFVRLVYFDKINGESIKKEAMKDL